jgi:hypothetical protein
MEPDANNYKIALGQHQIDADDSKALSIGANAGPALVWRRSFGQEAG